MVILAPVVGDRINSIRRSSQARWEERRSGSKSVTMPRTLGDGPKRHLSPLDWFGFADLDEPLDDSLLADPSEIDGLRGKFVEWHPMRSFEI